MISMVEWDSGPHREMAVDVPESFVPRNKTPPRYPPQKPPNATDSLPSKKKSGTANADPPQNGRLGKPVPVPLPRDLPPQVPPRPPPGELKKSPPPPPPPQRTTVAAENGVPTREQSERLRRYQDELRQRREEEERRHKEEEFLRSSLRGSQKLQALSDSMDMDGITNDAFKMDDELPATYQKFGAGELVASLQRVQQAVKKTTADADKLEDVYDLLHNTEFRMAMAVHSRIQELWCYGRPPTPLCCDSHATAREIVASLKQLRAPSREATELQETLSKLDLQGALHAHDRVAERDITLSSLADGDGDVDPTRQYASEENVKIVKIEKSGDPLGATVRNEGDSVIIGRIVKGGAAERSGLFHEGDEILEVNGMEMRGKGINEVCDVLGRMTGTLTFFIVPSGSPRPSSNRREAVVHLRAHFDYDPDDDPYIPCRELGLSFRKGDVLHVLSQEDPNWWQAHRDGEEDQVLAGLIPSRNFQEQREAIKRSILGDTTETQSKSKRGTLLCGKRHSGKGRNKRKGGGPYSASPGDSPTADDQEIPTYEEVSLYYPRANHKRPTVLVGPPNIGRHELRQRLMQDSDRFAAAVPHTSRPRRDPERDGHDYHFITRAQFEADIASRKFVEHGEYEKAYYGTSLEAIRSVVQSGRICVLNLHPQSLKILRGSDLKPFVVFVAPPPLERLKQLRISRREAFTEEEFIEIIEKAREMEDRYGHLFDLVLLNNDTERTYHELLQRINFLEREPQWVPGAWLK